MSDSEFHVHGAHEHELEHPHDAHADKHASRMAVATAILATIGAIFSYMGGATQADAALYKNDAAIRKTEASNQWNYYQAKSSKQNLAELSIELIPLQEKRDKYQQEVERYKVEKEEIKVKATKLEEESSSFDERSEAQMHQHHRWAQATTLIQVAIALAAIALLTKNKLMEKSTFVSAGVGIVIGLLALLHV
jgi:FtsZ-binding cell division protein ZapB